MTDNQRELEGSNGRSGVKPLNILRWIVNLPRRIVNLPPSAWGALYLLVIPLAGFVFLGLPAGSFYDSNLARESGYRQDLTNMAPLLTSAIRKQEDGDQMGRKLNAPFWKAFGERLFINRDSVSVVLGSIQVQS